MESESTDYLDTVLSDLSRALKRLEDGVSRWPNSVLRREVLSGIDEMLSLESLQDLYHMQNTFQLIKSKIEAQAEGEMLGECLADIGELLDEIKAIDLM